jgi:hypothetical protein
LARAAAPGQVLGACLHPYCEEGVMASWQRAGSTTSTCAIPKDSSGGPAGERWRCWRGSYDPSALNRIYRYLSQRLLETCLTLAYHLTTGYSLTGYTPQR